MGVKTSGSLSLTSDIRGEFGGSAPHYLSEYKRGGSYVPNISANNNIPTSNSDIRFSDFYGTTAYTPSAQYWTSNGTYTINPSETSFQYKLSGGGGGGGKIQCLNCGPDNGSAGGATTLKFKNSSGSVIHTLTAAGGAGGVRGTSWGCDGGTNEFNESGYPNPPWTPNTGGNWNTNGTSDGGGGGSGEENCIDGCHGLCGIGITGTISTPSGATSITITIGGGGSPGCTSQSSPPKAGRAGAAWLLGVQ